MALIDRYRITLGCYFLPVGISASVLRLQDGFTKEIEVLFEVRKIILLAELDWCHGLGRCQTAELPPKMKQWTHNPIGENQPIEQSYWENEK